MNGFKFELGDAVKDVVTGFNGIITGRSEFITGCRQYSVTARKLEGGETKIVWFDEDRLKATKAAKVKLKITNDGGPQITPAKG